MKNYGSVAASIILLGSIVFGAGVITGVNVCKESFQQNYSTLIKLHSDTNSVVLYTEPCCSAADAKRDGRKFVELFNDSTAEYHIYSTFVSTKNNKCE